MKYQGLKTANLGEEITTTKDLVINNPVIKTDYAYVMGWDDYYAPAALYFMQSKGLIVATAFKPFSVNTNTGNKEFNYGSILVPVSKQKKNSQEVYDIIKEAQEKFNVPITSTNTGFNTTGIDLGSNNFRALKKPKTAVLIGNGVSSYEAGEVWHLLDQRMDMQLTHLEPTVLRRADLSRYTAIIITGGSYSDLDKDKLKNWVQAGGTLICTERKQKLYGPINYLLLK